MGREEVAWDPWCVPSFVLGGDANTGSAGYVCLETELMGGESDFHAAMLAAFAFAALMGWPSCFAVDSPAVPAALSGGMRTLAQMVMFASRTELVDWEPDFFAALPAAFAFAALMGWPSCFVVDSPAVPVVLSGGMLCYAALFRGSLSFLGACCDAVLGCAFRWLRWVCLLR